MNGVNTHSFDRDGWTLWADRIPAVHGRYNHFTLWKPEQGRQRRVFSGRICELRAFLEGARS